MNQQAARSKIVHWGGYLALLLLLALPLSILLVRAGLWQQGLAIYALCCLGAALLLAAFAMCMAVPRFTPHRLHLAIRSLALLPGSILLFTLLAGRGDYPAIHDITTDTADPPTFSEAVKIRGKSANTLEISADTIKLQTEAYPDVATFRSALSFEDAFTRAVEVAKDIGWEITLNQPDAGIIEAVDTTAVMAFKDDIVIRLRRSNGETLVDLRSASRVGVSDLGANSKRIRLFFDHYKS